MYTLAVLVCTVVHATECTDATKCAVILKLLCIDASLWYAVYYYCMLP